MENVNDIDESGSKIARNSVFDCLLPKTVSSDFGSSFVDS